MSKKKICKLVKEDFQKDNPKEYKKLVKKAKFVCSKCGRVAVEEKHLCKPDKL